MVKPSNWSDNQWYNFMAGLLAGLRLRNNKADYYEEDVVLAPISVGGATIIGIGASQVLTNGVGNKVTVAVYTHNTNIDYSMFSVRLNFDSSKCFISDVYGGEFGEFGVDMAKVIGSGTLNVVGQKPDGVSITTPMILFLIDFIVTSDILLGEKIELELASTGDYTGTANDILLNYTTLLKYVEGNLYFITPVENVDGAIVSEKVSNENVIETETNVQSTTSPMAVRAGKSKPNKDTGRGMFPMFVNSNESDAFAYNKFTTVMTIVDPENKVNIGYPITRAGWSLSIDYSTDIEGNEVQTITGTRDAKLIDVCTVAGFDYTADVLESFSVPLKISNSKLWDDDISVDVKDISGLISFNIDGVGGIGPGQYEDLAGSTSGYGEVWSSSEQIAWFGLGDGVMYPVALSPGSNYIYIDLPHINTSEQTNTDTKNIVVESDGYILIPAGFVFVTHGQPGLIKKPFPAKMIDAVKVVDFLSSEIYNNTPVDLDAMIDAIKASDIMSLEQQLINLQHMENIDTLRISDVYGTLYLENGSTDLNSLHDRIHPIDIESIDEVHVVIKEGTEGESIVVSDIFDYDI